MESHDYHFRRNPEADTLSLEGTETGYLLRLLMGNSVNEDYKKLIRKELKERDFTEDEITFYELGC